MTSSPLLLSSRRLFFIAIDLGGDHQQRPQMSSIDSSRCRHQHKEILKDITQSKGSPSDIHGRRAGKRGARRTRGRAMGPRRAGATARARHEGRCQTRAGRQPAGRRPAAESAGRRGLEKGGKRGGCRNWQQSCGIATGHSPKVRATLRTPTPLPR